MRQRLTGLEEANEDVRARDAAALEGALVLDAMEAADEPGATR